jgi:hypothetical protein
MIDKCKEFNKTSIRNIGETRGRYMKRCMQNYLDYICSLYMSIIPDILMITLYSDYETKKQRINLRNSVMSHKFSSNLSCSSNCEIEIEELSFNSFSNQPLVSQRQDRGKQLNPS